MCTVHVEKFYEADRKNRDCYGLTNCCDGHPRLFLLYHSLPLAKWAICVDTWVGKHVCQVSSRKMSVLAHSTTHVVEIRKQTTHVVEIRKQTTHVVEIRKQTTHVVEIRKQTTHVVEIRKQTTHVCLCSLPSILCLRNRLMPNCTVYNATF